MSNYDQQKLLSFLQRKWRNNVCPMCGANQWGVSDKAMELREYQQGNLVIGGALQPVIPVNCGNCGYTILINGLITGVIERPKEEEGKK
jgi:ribosomal protein S27AE